MSEQAFSAEPQQHGHLQLPRYSAFADSSRIWITDPFLAVRVSIPGMVMLSRALKPKGGFLRAPFEGPRA